MRPFEEIYALRKEGKVEEAYLQGYELLEEKPQDTYLKQAIAWVLFDKIKEHANDVKQDESRAPAAASQVRELLKKFARLSLSRPDLCFSLILVQIMRLPNENLNFLPSFLYWAGIDAYREEDYIADRQEGSDNVFDPLIERAARTAGKIASGMDQENIREFTIALIDRTLEKAENQREEWLHYHKSSLLHSFGKVEEAVELLTPFVRGNQTAFWAWHALFKVLRQQDPELSLALCSKACILCKDPKFGLRLYPDFAPIAVASGQATLAKWAVDRALQTRIKKGWRIPPDLQVLIESAWYQSAIKPDNPVEELQKLAEPANRFLYSDCPAYEGTYLGTFETKTGKTMVKVSLKVSGQFQEEVTPAKLLSEHDQFNLGAPVIVGLFETKQWSTIISMQPRPEGKSFDCLEAIYGVLKYHNKERQRSGVYITCSEFSTIAHPEFPIVVQLPVGTPISMKVTRHRERIRPHHLERTSFKETEDIRQFQGTLAVHEKGFGFVDGVYIAPPLLGPAKTGEEYTVLAVSEVNPKKGTLGWTGIKMEK